MIEVLPGSFMFVGGGMFSDFFFLYVGVFIVPLSGDVARKRNCCTKALCMMICVDVTQKEQKSDSLLLI